MFGYFEPVECFNSRSDVTVFGSFSNSTDESIHFRMKTNYSGAASVKNAEVHSKWKLQYYRERSTIAVKAQIGPNGLPRKIDKPYRAKGSAKKAESERSRQSPFSSTTKKRYQRIAAYFL